MTPAALAQMIEELPPQDKEAAAEYIYSLHAKYHPEDLTQADAKYREYILQGIREGEEDIVSGDILDSRQASEYLEELLKK